MNSDCAGGGTRAAVLHGEIDSQVVVEGCAGGAGAGNGECGTEGIDCGGIVCTGRHRAAGDDDGVGDCGRSRCGYTDGKCDGGVAASSG